MKKLLYMLLMLFLISACSSREISIVSLTDSSIGKHATSELVRYLSGIYPDVSFHVVNDGSEAEILLMLNSQLNGLGYSDVEVPDVEEGFRIVPRDNKLLIISPDERGLLNAVYSLLEQQGCGFYISGDRLPDPKKWNGFSNWGMEDQPILGDRSLFNWHNFLSGCTGWDLEDWKLWIDHANKMRYNGIMLHAYGNNPMFSYDYLGETKPTGYLNNSANGRDWGNQHVNDVRRMTGGEIFDGPVYGARPSFASEDDKVAEVTKMMFEVFEYAEQRRTRIIFALDFDTWMTHPANIVEKLPRDALFELNGYLTPNPEHPEGYKFYRNQVKELLHKYPQIDELTVWSRSPSNKVISVLGTIWMAFPYDRFPETWKEEYKGELSKNESLEDDLRTQGLFAFSKLVEAIKQAAAEIKPALEIGYGSWGFEWLEIADILLPKGIGFRPLDARITFDTDAAREFLSTVGDRREIHPVIWAHHDDFAYIGRPYTPYKNLSDLISERRISGLGILHWTTHPLDLYFTGTSRQLWRASANEPVQSTVRSFVTATFGQPDEELVDYFYDWLTRGPIFGRETSDHFMDLGKRHWKSNLEPWDKMIQDAKRRLQDLDAVTEESRNDYWKYQKGMEQFYISFFENQQAFDTAYRWLENGEIGSARDLMAGADPDITIEKYVDAMQNIGFTSGEEALVLSLNTRWKTDFVNLKQRLGMEPVRIRFSPTRHDPLAQVPGVNTYHIDETGRWWICLWNHELPENTFGEENGKPALLVEQHLTLSLTTMHGQVLPPGEFELILDSQPGSDATLIVFENDRELAKIKLAAGEKPAPVKFNGTGGEILLVINTDGNMRLNGLEINPLNQQK